MGKTIKQKVLLKAAPEEVYDALMDSKKHSDFTGEPAVINKKVGGTVKAYGDYISGMNLKLIQGKAIVQSWRASDWEKGVLSTVTFKFTKTAKGTELEFIHENVPQDQISEISAGWKEYYWKPLKVYFQSKKK